LKLMRSLLDGLAQLYSNTLFLGNLFEFLALRPTLTAPLRPRQAPAGPALGMRFRDVTFRYPGAEQPVLRDFNLEIPAGRIVALVGPNGAGKTTLIKLLCRFYDPEAGRIELDDADLREFAPEELRQRIAVLFQDPQRYNLTAGENIALGDAERPCQPGEVEAAAKAAGAEAIVEALPARYESPLGRLLEEGAELSAGQWQRIALARAFYRRAPVIILDEPTGAMDPWAEREWVEGFRAAAAGSTAILITHRLTTAACADVIHVIAGGEVVESGSHQELLALGGRYAQCWGKGVPCW
jgi:ATP-binding cassette subfamily B protein